MNNNEDLVNVYMNTINLKIIIEKLFEKCHYEYFCEEEDNYILDKKNEVDKKTLNNTEAFIERIEKNYNNLNEKSRLFFNNLFNQYSAIPKLLLNFVIIVFSINTIIYLMTIKDNNEFINEINKNIEKFIGK